MRPDKIVIRHVRMRLRTPFVTALGVEHERDIIIIEVHADEFIGYGEVPVLAQPVYNEETVETAWHVLNDFFVDKVLATSLSAPGDVPRRLGGFKGHAFAKAGLEAAVWDVWSRHIGVSLSEMLGGAARGVSLHELARRVPSGVVVGIANDDGRRDTGGGANAETELLGHVETFLEQGYRRIKIKIEPGRDDAPLRAVRRAFGNIVLGVDANGTYRLEDAEALRRLDEFDLSLIEQPLAAHDVIDHAELQRAMRTPICLDESISTQEQARQALQLGSCRIVNIKASRVGGLTEAIALHDMCRARGIAVLCGGLLESGIGRAHNVALASLPGFTLPGDLSASARYWERDVVSPAFELDDEGYIAVPTGPGIGVEIDHELLDALTVRTQIHGAS